MTIRAKFKVGMIARYAPGMGAHVKLTPVYSTDPEHENKKFWDATPNGNIELHIQNPIAVEAFELGAEYYVDFTKVE